VYIVVLNVLYDDIYMYKSLQIKFLFCSVLLKKINILLITIPKLIEPN